MLDVYDFGAALLRAKDLDPVYEVAYRVRDWIDETDMAGWLLAYWCFYHMGTACWITSGDDGDGPSESRHHERWYWDRMEQAAASKDYPRGHERRHFRGANASNSVAFLRDRGLEALFLPFYRMTLIPEGADVYMVTEYVREWVGFGPWIAFKVADMLERLGILRVQFDASGLLFYDSPLKGAEMLWAEEHDDEENIPPPEVVVSWAVNRILRVIGKEKAPPRYERTLNVQEAETVLCKWKSYRNGHYKIGEDVNAGFHALYGFLGKSPLAEKLLQAGAEVELW